MPKRPLHDVAPAAPVGTLALAFVRETTVADLLAQEFVAASVHDTAHLDGMEWGEYVRGVYDEGDAGHVWLEHDGERCTQILAGAMRMHALAAYVRGTLRPGAVGFQDLDAARQHALLSARVYCMVYAPPRARCARTGNLLCK